MNKQELINSLSNSASRWMNDLILDTTQLDKERIERGIKGIYAFCDLPQPEVVYAKSPLEAEELQNKYKVKSIPNAIQDKIFADLGYLSGSLWIRHRLLNKGSEELKKI